MNKCWTDINIFLCISSQPCLFHRSTYTAFTFIRNSIYFSTTISALLFAQQHPSSLLFNISSCPSRRMSPPFTTSTREKSDIHFCFCQLFVLPDVVIEGAHQPARLAVDVRHSMLLPLLFPPIQKYSLYHPSFKQTSDQWILPETIPQSCSVRLASLLVFYLPPKFMFPEPKRYKSDLVPFVNDYEICLQNAENRAQNAKHDNCTHLHHQQVLSFLQTCLQEPKHMQKQEK